MQQVTVRVPASTSNLGPGFDCLGAALRLYNRITVGRSSRRVVSPILKKTGRLFFQRARLTPFAFSCEVTDEIPRGRGLGSSATVRAGLLLGLNELAGRPLTKQDIFELCTVAEGHPDNAAPAVFGGFTVVRASQVQRFRVGGALHFVLLVPSFEISTPAARRILPARVSRRVAIANSANACAITAAFASRKYQSLAGAFGDQLHQPYRGRLIPFLSQVIETAERNGALGAFLSGSGSTIAAVTLRSTERIARAMKQAARSHGADTMILSCDNGGAKIVRHR
jgi:homoserine kinase